MRSLAAVLVCMLLSSRAMAERPPLDVSGNGMGAVFPRAEGFFDPTLAVDFAQVQAPAIAARFTPLATNAYNKKPVPGALWGRFAVHHPGATRLDRLLVVDNRSIDELDVWMEEADGAFTHYRGSQDLPIAQRVIPTTTPLFPLALVPGATRHIFMRFNAEIMTATAEVLDLPEVISREKTRHLACGVLFGLVLLVTAYTAYFCVRLRESLHAWLAATGVGMLLFLAFYVTLMIVSFSAGRYDHLTRQSSTCLQEFGVPGARTYLQP